jgi:aspartate/methionine/tyrosine aminotransferase
LARRQGYREFVDDSSADLLQFYADHFRPGAIDLSASCPPPMPIEGFEGRTLRAEDLSFVPPTGAPGLRAAIAERYETLTAADIVISAGASEALVALAQALLERGQSAWVAPGTYPSFIEAAHRLGACVQEGGAIRCGTALALGCNPTVREGARVALKRFLAECRDAGAVPVMDEVYRDLHLPEPLPALADQDASAVSIGDLSKPLGLGGLRIGWVATRDDELRARIDRELQLLSGGPSSLSVAAAESAFRSFDEVVTATMQAAIRNLPRITSVLESHGWRVVPSEAGLTVLGVPPEPVGSEALGRLEEAGFFLLAGDTIGAPRAFRITLLREPETFDRALSILEAHVA